MPNYQYYNKYYKENLLFLKKKIPMTKCKINTFKYEMIIMIDN